MAWIRCTGGSGGGSATLITKTITQNDTYDASDDGADGYSRVTVNVQSSPTLVTKTITQNGTYSAQDDNADGYDEVTVNVSGGGSSAEVERLVYVEYIGNDANEIPRVNSMVEGDNFASYLSFDSTTRKFTVLQPFTALIVPWVKQFRQASTYGEGEFYINDVNQTWFRVRTGSAGQIGGTRLWYDFQQGDVFWSKTPNANGYPQQYLKVYRCVDTQITSDNFAFEDEAV